MEITRKDFIYGFIGGIIVTTLIFVVYIRTSEVAPRSSLDSQNTTKESQSSDSTGDDLASTKFTINVLRGGLLQEPFTNPVHIDLYLNSATVFTRDAQDGSAVTFENIPFGVYKSRVRAIGYKESVNTFTYKNDGDTVKVVLEN